MMAQTALQSLSCVKNVRLLPASLSIHHSVDLLPIETHTGLITAVTVKLLNSNYFHTIGCGEEDEVGEIRVVHGQKEVQDIITSVVGLEAKPEAAEEAAAEARVWTVPLKKGVVFEQHRHISLSCRLLEALIRCGWEVVTSCQTTITPGYELVTWFFKRSTSPALHNAQVSAVVFDEVAGQVEIVTTNGGQPEMNNAVHRAIKKCLGTTASPTTSSRAGAVSPNTPSTGGRSSVDMAKEIEIELRKSREALEQHWEPPAPRPESVTSSTSSGTKLPVKTFAKAIYRKGVRDNPNCPHVFAVEALAKSEPDLMDKATCSNLVLEIVHLLFCRQWKMVASSQTPVLNGDQTLKEVEVLYFCRDGRILPALGQQSFAMVDMEQPNLVHVHNADKCVEACIKEIMAQHCPSAEGKEGKYSSLLDKPWQPEWETEEGREENEEGSNKDGPLVRAAISSSMVGHFLLAMNRNEFNLYGSTRLRSQHADKRCQLIFKHSNVGYSEMLCLHLSGQNKMLVVGGSQTEVDIIRGAVTARWPYPITQDRPVEVVVGKSSRIFTWLFKLKRYPWAISSGNKHVDRLFDTAKNLLKNRLPKAIRPPKNTDADSGKSLVLFILKDLASLGWRLQTSVDICSSQTVPYTHGTARPTNPYSIFLLR